MTFATFSVLGLNGGRTLIHIRLDRIVMGIEVIEDFILKGPFEKVELSNRCVEFPELNALPTAEGVKHLFAIGLEVRLVRQVYNHVLSVFRQIRNIVLLRIIGHKPVNQSETHP